MKQILMGSAVLTLFAISVTLFQISCQKESKAQATTYTLPPATTSSLGGIIVGNGLAVSSNGTLSVTCCGSTQQNKIIFEKYPSSTPIYSVEIWTANYDGTGQTKINITLPNGLGIAGQARLSPDGQTVFFNVGNRTTQKFYIYSCKIDGTNVQQVIDGSSLPQESLNLQGVN